MTTSRAATPIRPGRRPGTSTTRQDVLAAARARFATDGFAATTIRAVAQDAGVDPALVMQFFGSKNELFAAVMSLSPSALTRLDAAFADSGAHRGEHVVNAFLDVWEGVPADAEPLMAMLRGAVVNDLARRQLHDFIEARLAAGVAARAPGLPDAGLRAGLVASMLVGLIFGRDIVAVPTLAAAEREHLVRLIGPAVQNILTADAESHPRAAESQAAR